MEGFPILFTGREVSFEPRTTGELERSRKRFDERFLEGQRFKRAEKEKGKEFFFKTADIDPVQAMSKSITEEQDQDLKLYNEKWAGIYAEQGILTDAQQTQMFGDRKRIESKQASMLASQQLLTRDWELIKRDQVKANPILDHGKFAEAFDRYNKGEPYKGGLQYSPEDLYGFYNKKRKTWEGTTPSRKDISQTIGGVAHISKVGATGTIENARDEVESDILGDRTGRKLMGAVAAFQEQPDEVKNQYLIEGEVDTPDEKNAIIRWAQDEFAPLLRQVDVVTGQKESARGDRLDNGRGVSSSGKMYFQPAENVSGPFIGKDTRGIEWVDAKPIAGISPDKLELPEGMNIINPSVTLQPIRAGSGKVEFRISSKGIKVLKKTKSPIKDVKDRTERTRALSKGRGDDGYYTYEEPLEEGTIVAATLKDVYGDLNAQYGNNIFKTTIDKYFPGWETGTTKAGGKWLITGEKK